MLFVYGTLQDPQILAAALGRSVGEPPGRPAMAPGFCTRYYPGRVYPALVRQQGRSAAGLVLENLADLDLAALDLFEGNEYVRQTITVVCGKQRLDVQAYLPTAVIPADSPAWSLEAWTRWHKADAMAAEITLATDIHERLRAPPDT